MGVPTVDLFVTFDGDNVGRLAGRAVLNNDAEELARISHRIDRGQAVIRSWAVAAGGRVIEAGGDEVTVQIPAEALKDLPAVRQTYHSAVDVTLSAGVGKKLSEAGKALMAAKLRGKDQVAFYDESVEKEVAGISDKSEAEKLSEEYLQKAEGSAQQPAATPPSLQTEEHSEGEVAQNDAAAIDDFAAGNPHVEAFHQAAAAQDRADRAAAMRQSTDYEQLKQSVAAALGSLREQLPVLGQLKSAYPDTYKSVMGLVQSVIALAQGLKTSDAELQKAERGFMDADLDSLLMRKGTPDPTKPHVGLNLPPGTLHHGRLKVKHADGSTGWRGVRAGMIQGQEPGAPLFGHSSHPVSSREPGAK